MKLRFVGSRDEVKNVRTFRFEPQEKITWQPGQYMHYVLDLPQTDDKGPERWFTNSAAPFEERVQITTRLDNEPFSAFKKYLCNLKEGDEIETDGPNGKFVLDPEAKKHVLIAGGIGITPFRSMLAQLAHDKQPAKAVLLYANKDDLFVFDKELQSYAEADETLKIIKFAGKRIEQADLDPFTKEDGVTFYLSGPKGMVESYEHTLPEMGVDPERVKKDYFPGY